MQATGWTSSRCETMISRMDGQGLLAGGGQRWPNVTGQRLRSRFRLPATRLSPLMYSTRERGQDRGDRPALRPVRHHVPDRRAAHRGARMRKAVKERKGKMPKTSKSSASEIVEVEGYEGHLENLEGGYTVAFEKYTADADLAPFFAGLPNDQCQSAHWGYVVSGKVDVQDHHRRGDIRDRRRLLRCTRSHPRALRRHRGHRVQPD